MEANVMKSRSELSLKTRRRKHPPPPLPNLDAKTFSSRQLSSSSISHSKFLNPSDLHNCDDNDDSSGHQLNCYGGTTVSVPFTWESQPGTPKVRFCDDVVPPLLPPPSYFCTPAQDANNSKQRRKTKFFTNILPKLRSLSPSSPASYSSSSSSSLWSSVPPSPAMGGCTQTSTSRLSFPTRVRKWEEEEFEVHDANLCFGFGHRGTNARPRGLVLGHD